jgi:hypothetical protein
MHDVNRSTLRRSPLWLLPLAVWLGCIDSHGLSTEAGAPGSDAVTGPASLSDAAMDDLASAPDAVAGDALLAAADAAPLPDAVLADVPVAPPDAAVLAPDAAIGASDAAIAPPDAAVVAPDAAVVLPDAAAPMPDAAVVLPDAAAPMPDAAIDQAVVIMVPPPLDAAPLSPDAPPVFAVDGPEDTALQASPPDAAADLVPDANPDLAPPETVLFHDDFESGDLAKWTGSQGTRAVGAGCALEGSHGLRVDADQTPGKVWFDLPSARSHVKATVRFNVGGYSLDPAIDSVTALLSLRTAADGLVTEAGYSPNTPYSSKIHAEIWRVGGGFRQIHNDRPLTPGPHTVQLEWQGSSQLGVADGSVTLLVDGLPGLYEPNKATGELTSSTTVSRLYLGFVFYGGSGFICFDDVTLVDLP